ncbi:MAG: ATP-binding cassette domain-containing protein [Dehalococcoidia bacterium]
MTHPGAAYPVLSNVSLGLERGETVAILGANGSGKSTLCFVLAGALAPDSGAVSSEGRSPAEWAFREVQLVQQSADDQIVAPLVFDDIAFGVRNLGLDEDAVEARVTESLRAVGMDGFSNAAVSQLSGGERCRLALAGALAVAPDFLILDETTAHLDQTTASDLLSLVRRKVDAGMGALFVTHRLREAEHADRVLVLHEGAIVCEGIAGEVLGDHGLLVQYGLAPAARRPLASKRWHAPEGGSEALLRLEGLCVGSKDLDRLLLQDVSLTVRAGEIVVVTGPSGAGKTTLLQAAAALRDIHDGAVEWSGVPVEGTPSKVMRDGIGVLFQEPERMFFLGTVRSELEYGLRNLGVSSAARDERMHEVLEAAGLSEGYLARHPFTLSGGEGRLVALVAVLATKPKLLLLDEPTAGLSPEWSARVESLLDDQRRKGCGILVATHDSDGLIAISDRVVELCQGRIRDESPASQAPDGTSGHLGGAAGREASPEAGRAEPPLSLAAGLLFGALTGLAFLLATSLLVLVGLAAGLLVLAAVWRLDWRRLRRVMIPVLLLGAVAGGLHLVTTEGRALWAMGPFAVSWEGAEAALRALLRVVGPVWAGMVAIGHREPAQIARGLSRLLSAAPLVRRWAQDAAIALLLVVRLVPVLYEELRRIELAQTARGVDRGRGSLWQRGQSMLGLVIPTLASALQRAERLALALQLRGLGAAPVAAKSNEALLAKGDYPWLVLGVGVFVITLLV